MFSASKRNTKTLPTSSTAPPLAKTKPARAIKVEKPSPAVTKTQSKIAPGNKPAAVKPEKVKNADKTSRDVTPVVEGPQEAGDVTSKLVKSETGRSAGTARDVDEGGDVENVGPVKGEVF